ncbi:hypothetical protein E1301_Tti013876 [Triplophysa tibetana]|uniref:RING-type E3 ubiquitin transferase n=1 Tax=Triplophysa tibetana TaxID=1572043 RepID=A0A5A9P3V5_9TELE|nr:hypothetical protein E1301_Tti013876 [Triplophysa tibetana]
MREILNAVYGLLILPEADDPLDSVLAEEFQTSKEGYEQAAKDDTAKNASQSMESIEKKYIGDQDVHIPQHLICPLSKQMFIDPVKTKYGNVYERKAIEEWIKTNQSDPLSKKELKTCDLKEDKNMKKSAQEFRLAQMEKIYKLLEKFRLQEFYKRFLDFGIKEEQDFIDSVNDETLKDLGLSQAEMARYQSMITYLQRIGSTHTPEMQPMKSLDAFHVFYRYPKCAERQEITGLDPSQNTVDDVMLRICHENNVGRHTSVCLYTADGMALTDDPFFNTWSLKDRHIVGGSELYAIFTPKENLKELPKRDMTNIKNEGPDVIRCHIMLQGDFEIKVDLEHDTLRELKWRLSLESGMPVSVLHCRNSSDLSRKLSTFEITEDLVLQFSLSSFDHVKPDLSLLFHNDVKPSVMQTQKGLSVFLSTLYAIKENHYGGNFKTVIAYIRKLSGCNALAQSLYQLVCLNARITRNQKIAVVEGLYFLFRELLPDLNDTSGPKTIEDSDVFEQANICWAYLIHQGENENADKENYATVSLRAYPTGCRMSEPVRIPGFSEVLERSYILEQIKDNLGLYFGKEKGSPNKIEVYDCLSGKMVTENVEDLAHILNDVRNDNTFKLTKTPKEAIVVLFDSSSSMTEECYDTATQMKRIEAVKQIFDSFSNRSMAYDLPHVICLVKFNTDVETILDFTENLETFKEQVHGIEASGYTRLYDALLHGISELEKVKQRFPACRCRILCLTDGNDYRSHNNPISVTNQLMDKKIVVDAVLLGKADNTVLHGISYVTGGYCFKPETAKAALKLLEMETVLSMEMRAERTEVPVSSVKTKTDLTRIFVKHGYDVEPKKKLPPQITHKVNRTESVLAEEFQTNKQGFEQAAKAETVKTAGQSVESIEKMFVDPVKSKYGIVYERKAIEEWLKTNQIDPVMRKSLSSSDLKQDANIKRAVQQFRRAQVEETE